MIDLSALPDLPADRVRLRWLTDADAGDIFAIFSEPDVTRYWSSPAFSDLSQARELIRHIHACFEDRSLIEWGIEDRETGRVIGTCTLADLDTSNRRAEVGFALARPWWGRGIAFEAVTAVLDFGFSALELHRVEADADPRNAASIRLLERLGFVREGTLRERWIVAGELQDTAFFGILRREWEARRG